MKRDPVSPELRQLVFERDRGCIAPRVCGCAGEEDPCAGRLTLDHVKLCARHQLESSWATSHRLELRQYLAAAERLR